MRLKLFATCAIALLVVVAVYIHLSHKQTRTDRAVVAAPLAATDKEEIVVDPRSHQIEIKTATGIKKEFLPGMRPSTVEVKKDGSVVVKSPQMGVEHGLYVGSGYGSSSLRFYIGVDLVYVRRFDGGLFVSDETKDLKQPRIGLGLSYNFWHDTRLTIGIDNAGSTNVLISERF